MLLKLVIVLLIYIALSVVVAEAKHEAKVDLISAKALDKKVYIMVVDIDKTLVARATKQEHDNFIAHNTPVVFRPDIDFFFKNFSKNFYIVLYTTAKKEYAEAIFKEINRRNSDSVMELRHREHCGTAEDNNDKVCTKNLDYIMTPDQKLKAFMVDDSLPYINTLGRKGQNDKVIQIAAWNGYQGARSYGEVASDESCSSSSAITQVDPQDDHLFDIAKYLATYFLVPVDVLEVLTGFLTTTLVKTRQYKHAAAILKKNPYKYCAEGHVSLGQQDMVERVEKYRTLYCDPVA